MTKIGDIEPISPAEFEAMLEACYTVIGRMAFEQGLAQHARALADWQGVLRFLRETGAHPSVLSRSPAQVESYGPQLTPDGEGYAVVWNRPKSMNPVRGWIGRETGDWLLTYHARNRSPVDKYDRPFSRQWVWHICSQTGKAAGIRGPVTPRRLRHTLGIELTAKAGAGVARESLRVSEGVLLQYLRRTDQGSYDALKAVAMGRKSA